MKKQLAERRQAELCVSALKIRRAGLNRGKKPCGRSLQHQIGQVEVFVVSSEQEASQLQLTAETLLVS